MALHLDLTGLFGDGSDGRLTRDEFDAALPRAIAAREAHLAAKPEWRGLGGRSDFLDECQARAKEVLEEQAPEALVVLGIGGSALGAQALLSALAPLYQESQPAAGRPRVFVPDSVDPDWLGALLEHLPLERTHVNVISKSGGTIETSAEFLVFYDAIRQAVGSDEEARKRFTITTDPASGHFRKIADELGFTTLTVPPGVGGRFSVLTSVGLFPAELAGMDTQSLLEGAARVDQKLDAAEPTADAALAYALAHVLYMERGKPIHVHFPYSQRARLLADWYAQLWAESLGKRVDLSGAEVHVGPTPVRAVGPTDQHSQCQLYVEGPDDKVYTLLKLGKFGRELTVPEPFVESPAFSHLAGRRLDELMEAERQGTEVALLEAGRPVCTIELCKLDAFHVGQYFLFLEAATAYAGGLLGIDPFDQPGVEAGKVAALALMGAPGYEERAQQIRANQAARTLFTLTC
ncbi:MAG: glucose-6-phosphate isomerase [Planctomycetes bacterium]|nr:glucose-6-phosphate isomerase [Planctomycetota bacterium]